MAVNMKLTKPFNGRMAGDVMECSIKLAANLIETEYGEETDDPVTPNPGASPESEVGRTAASWAAEAKEADKPRRGRPPKTPDAADQPDE